MKTALVLGVNGNFGNEMAKALINSGWQVRALVRDANRAPSYIAQSELFIGDASSEQQVRAASDGVDLIVYAVNPPYHRWPELALKLLEPALNVAEAQGVQFLFPANVYNYNAQAQPIDEQVKQAAPTEKGRIRMAMEARLKQAAEGGARVTVVRAGDFIGPETQLSWLDHGLKQSSKGVTVKLPHDHEHRHFWTYLPDLAANAVAVIEQADWTYQEFHDVGLALKTEDWLAAFKQIGIPTAVKTFPWWFFYCVAPFSPMLREVIKMRYLWQQPVILDGGKLKNTLGAKLQQTPLKHIVKELYAQ